MAQGGGARAAVECFRSLLSTLRTLLATAFHGLVHVSTPMMAQKHHLATRAILASANSVSAPQELEQPSRADNRQPGASFEHAACGFDGRGNRALLATTPASHASEARRQQDVDADEVTAALQSVRAMSRPLSGIPAPSDCTPSGAAHHHAEPRAAPATSPLAEVAAQERVGQLQEEMGRLRMEREHAAAVRANMEQASRALQQERAAFEAHKVSAHARARRLRISSACLPCFHPVVLCANVDVYSASHAVSTSLRSCLQATVAAAQEADAAREAERLRRERAALERQSRSLAKLPSRKERSEIEALEAVVEQARKDGKARDARHKLTVERLRRQIVSLQARAPRAWCACKQARVHWR